MRATFAPRIAQNQRTYRKRNRKPDPQPARGEQCGNCVMDEEMVRTIRAMRFCGLGPQKIQEELASDGYSFNMRTIQNVVYGLTWRHVR